VLADAIEKATSLKPSPALLEEVFFFFITLEPRVE